MNDNVKRTSFSLWMDYLYLTLVLLAVYGLFLGMHPLLIPDEARYSEVAREMLVNHQFLTPQLDGIDFFDKPILFYWLQALSMAIFGVNEWAVRLFPMLFGVFGAAVVYGTCKQLYNRETAWICALILASSPIYFISAHYANLDLEVAVLITASLCFFIRAYQPTTKTLSSSWLYAAYALAGLAVLTKGLIGIVFPIMIIGLWIAITNQWFLVRQMKILQGLALFLLITLPWFVAVAYKNEGFLHYFFYVQQFLRFLTASFNNIEPWWFYFPIVIVGFTPWFSFLYTAARNYEGRKNSSSTFFIIWFAVVLVFFSIPHSKLLGYILPAIPPLAILAGTVYHSVSQQAIRRVTWCYIVFVLILGLSVWAIPQGITAHYGITIKLQAFISFAFFFLGVFLTNLARIKPTFMFAGLVFANFFILNLLFASYLLLPSEAFARFFPVKTAVTAVSPLIKSDDIIVTYFSYTYDVSMYTQKTALIVDDWNKPNLAMVDSWQGEFAYSMQYLQPSAKERLISPEQFALLLKGKSRFFVFVPKNKLSRWMQNIDQTAFCKVYAARKMTVFTNDLTICSK